MLNDREIFMYFILNSFIPVKTSEKCMRISGK
jgi:hypothetical protein